MTPRSVLRSVEDGDFVLAQKIADKEKFDANPIIERGAIRRYWSREQQNTVRITSRNRVSHDTAIEKLLPRFKADGVQFVFYRTEAVGLVDMSDLNKPLGRMVWLRPMLDCEQKIIEQTIKRDYEDADILRVLGTAARPISSRQRKSLQHNLKLPLLSFAYFREVLRAGLGLGMISVTEADR